MSITDMKGFTQGQHQDKQDSERDDSITSMPDREEADNNRKTMGVMESMADMKKFTSGLRDTAKKPPVEKKKTVTRDSSKPSQIRMTNDYKKNVIKNNPTYMAEDLKYLEKKNSEISKNFEKKSIFKQRGKSPIKEREAESFIGASFKNKIAQKGQVSDSED